MTLPTPSSLSAHDVGPSGRCCLCDAATQRTELRNVAVFNQPARGAIETVNKMAYESYAHFDLSICDDCAERRLQRTSLRLRRGGIGFLIGGLLGVAIVSVVVTLNPALARAPWLTMSAAVAPFLGAVVGAMRLPSSARDLPRLQLGRLNGTTEVLEGVHAPFPENLLLPS